MIGRARTTRISLRQADRRAEGDAQVVPSDYEHRKSGQEEETDAARRFQVEMMCDE